MITIERTYDAPPETVWHLWTTADGIERWWSPDGFTTDVQELDLRPGGALTHAMTATDPGMVQFMEANGMPLTNVGRKRFTEVEEPCRLAYVSEIDFVPGVAPYEHLTVVDLAPADGGGTRVTMTMDQMHDDEWTQRVTTGRENELANLAALLSDD